MKLPKPHKKAKHKKKRPPYKRKRLWVLSAFIILMVFAWDFLELRRSDDSFKEYFASAGLADVSAVRHRYVDGRDMRYVEVGQDHLPLVVFIHGTPSSSSFWYPFLDDSMLLANVKLMAVDRPGYGYSDFGKIETSVEKQAAYIADILKEKREKHERIVLYGSSYGGTVAMRIAMDYPELVDGIVLQSASLAPGQETTYWITYPTSHSWLSWMLPTTFQMANKEKLSHRAELEKMVPLWDKVKAPITILQGEEDGLVLPSNASFAKEHLVNSENVEVHMVPGRGHSLSWTEQELVKKSIISMAVGDYIKSNNTVLKP